MDHESTQLSRLEVVAAPQFALKYPCNPPLPPGRQSLGDPPPPPRETVARKRGTLEKGGGYHGHHVVGLG